MVSDPRTTYTIASVNRDRGHALQHPVAIPRACFANADNYWSWQSPVRVEHVPYASYLYWQASDSDSLRSTTFTDAQDELELTMQNLTKYLRFCRVEGHISCLKGIPTTATTVQTSGFCEASSVQDGWSHKPQLHPRHRHVE
jgi:hypothetical protein